MNDYYVYLSDGSKISVWEYIPGVSDVPLENYNNGGNGSGGNDINDPDAGSTVIVGDHKETSVPSSVSQTGIISDYTYYDQINWVNPCKPIYDKWVSTGKKSSYHIATIKGYYLIAMSPVCGSTGDMVTLVLEDGTEINAIIADVKGSDKGNNWGHVYDGKVSLVEWEIVNKPAHSEMNSALSKAGWYGKKISKVKNYGSYTNKIK